MRFTTTAICFFGCLLFFSKLTYGQFEGKLSYKITYSTEKAELKGMASMLPKSSSLIIKGEKLRYDQELAGAGRQAFVIDAASKTNTLLMNFLGQEFKVKLNEEELLQLESAEAYEIEVTDKTKTIEGYECEHALAILGEDSLNIYYAPEIKCPPVLPQFAEIAGLPLYYEINKGDFFMTYTCTSVVEQPISETEFEIPGKIKEIPFKEFAKSFAIVK